MNNMTHVSSGDAEAETGAKPAPIAVGQRWNVWGHQVTLSGFVNGYWRGADCTKACCRRSNPEGCGWQASTLLGDHATYLGMAEPAKPTETSACAGVRGEPGKKPCESGAIYDPGCWRCVKANAVSSPSPDSGPYVQLSADEMRDGLPSKPFPPRCLFESKVCNCERTAAHWVGNGFIDADKVPSLLADGIDLQQYVREKITFFGEAIAGSMKKIQDAQEALAKPRLPALFMYSGRPPEFMAESDFEGRAARGAVTDAIAGCRLGCACPQHGKAKAEPWAPGVTDWDLLPDASD